MDKVERAIFWIVISLAIIWVVGAFLAVNHIRMDVIALIGFFIWLSIILYTTRNYWSRTD